MRRCRFRVQNKCGSYGTVTLKVPLDGNKIATVRSKPFRCTEDAFIRKDVLYVTVRRTCPNIELVLRNLWVKLVQVATELPTEEMMWWALYMTVAMLKRADSPGNYSLDEGYAVDIIDNCLHHAEKRCLQYLVAKCE